MGDAVQRWRIVYARGEGARELDQRGELEAWEGAVRAAGIPSVATADGRPRLTFAVPLPVGLDADAERFDVGLTERLTRAALRSALEPQVPDAHRLVDAHDVWVGEPALPGRVVAADYRLAVEGVPAGRLAHAVTSLLEAASLPRVRRRGERETPYDLRPLLIALEVAPGEADPTDPTPGPAHAAGDSGDTARIAARLTVSPSIGIGRPDELVAALGEAVDRPIRLLGGRRERVWLADELPSDGSGGDRGREPPA